MLVKSAGRHYRRGLRVAQMFCFLLRFDGGANTKSEMKKRASVRQNSRGDQAGVRCHCAYIDPLMMNSRSPVGNIPTKGAATLSGPTL